MADSIHLHKKAYKANPEDDYEIIKSLWKLLDEADIVIGHNGDAFDIKKANARFIFHGMEPPSPFKTVDTLNIARKAKFTSNKLDSLGEHLGLGRKVDTGGFSLWEGCMNGEVKAFNKMLKYNKQDVILLEKVYNKLRPWTPRHPNLAVFKTKDERVCSHCGSTHLQSRGYYKTNTNEYRRYSCNDCGGWSRARRLVETNDTVVCDRK